MGTFEELIKEVSPTLKRIVYRVGGRAVSSGYDDLYQEAMLRLWLDYKEGKLEDKTRSYILQGCYFHLKNYLRKRFHKQETESLNAFTNAQGEDLDLGDILPSCRVDGPREGAHCNMLIEAIRNNGLTDREKEVFLLRLEGLTTREIGKRLDISHVRVVTLQKSMREKCRKHLDI
ncbi:MAG: sigma-70 family RNA polymerase sigma factor [Candidatus Omnitrophica bacterium]|nr:sigma-70 family RNA polymerase sigma factor [Candidatus Omnitrophota bacterium]